VDSLDHARTRRAELEARAAAFRLARDCTRGARPARRPSIVLRLYARLWWA
jgi:hypothetical protein